MALVPNVEAEKYRSGASRGGRDQFDWENVKSDVYRRNYLGHSLKAPIGHPAENGKMLWWTKESNKSKKRKKSKEASKREETSVQEEKDKVKLLEKALMSDALRSGYLLKSESYEKQKLTDSEFKNLITATRPGEKLGEGRRIKGLGLGATKKHDFVDRKRRSRQHTKLRESEHKDVQVSSVELARAGSTSSVGERILGSRKRKKNRQRDRKSRDERKLRRLLRETGRRVL